MVKIGIYDADGKLVSEFDTPKMGWRQGIPLTETVLDVSSLVKSPKLWSDETPYLYTVVMSLLDEKGNVLDVTSVPFGFREIEVKELQICINGKPTHFKGVNRAESDPVYGKTMTA